MPKYIAPSSDLERSGMLTRAFETGTEDKAAGRGYLAEETLTALATFAPEFAAKMDAVGEKRAGRSAEAGESKAAQAKLTRYVRDFWAVLGRRMVRREEPAHLRLHYGLPIEGDRPNPSTRDAWLKLAQQVVDGDAKAVKEGFAPMLNPSATEVGEVLAEARKELADVAPADRALDEAETAVAEARPKADELIDDIMADLRYHLRKLDPPSQRRIMRGYGARFISLPGEEPDPE